VVLQSVAGGAERSVVLSCKQGAQHRQVVLGPKTARKPLKTDIHPPADNIPSLADVAEFLGARAGVTVGGRESSTLNGPARV
jgi:hypothetical protein